MAVARRTSVSVPHVLRRDSVVHKVSSPRSFKDGNDSATDEAWIESEGQAWTRQPSSEDEEPELRGPERFFYDTSTYTGVHKNSGSPRDVKLRGHVDSFEYLRRQFEHRRQLKDEEHERRMADVDIEDLKNDPPQGTGDGEIDFELCGAIPPISHRRACDTAASAAITRSERAAATELIRKAREAESARVAECAEVVRKWEKDQRGQRGDVDMFQRRVLSPLSVRPSEDQLEPQSPHSCSSKSGLFVEAPEADLIHDGELVQATPALSPKGGTSPFPFKSWEMRITEFYRKWEAHKDQEEAVRLQVADEGFEVTRFKEAQQRKFEIEHKHCERQILAAKRRLDVNVSHKKYKEMTEIKLVTDDIWRKKQLVDCHEAAAATRERASAAKVLRNKAMTFVAQGAVLEKTCRNIDTQQVRAEGRAKACEHVADLQEKWAAKTARARGRRALQEAQQRIRDASDRGRVLYMAKIARDHQKEHSEEIRRKISAERNFRSCVQLARKGLETHGHIYKAESTELEHYEESLVALRELAEAVQKHGRMLNDRANEEDCDEDVLINLPPQLGPLSAAEPRIRAMLGLSDFPEEGYGCEREKETETPTTRAPSAGFTLDKTLLASSSRTSPAAVRHTSPAGLTESTVATSPAPPSRPRSQMAMSPLVVRPLRAICQQLHGKRSTTPNKGAARKEMQSLAALRKIRQTGPLIKR